ncbi:MAG: L,D-transpeptidase family protein [Alphaproteobacteria bacterium]|nr:L,D-transpeptidase family protein [Alphaproteobacteria bacterium]
MNVIRVDGTQGRLIYGEIDIPCVIGRSGSCPANVKQEGDGCTPLGRWPVRGALLRPGRVTLGQPLSMPWRWTRTNDGWSDGVKDPAYNRPVRLPRPWSAEHLQRDDAAYDVIIVLGHNDDPAVPGAGSAIFFHIWVDARPTEGCVAIAPAEMRRILPLLDRKTMMEIVS